jgi:acyl-CoA thioesterase
VTVTGPIGGRTGEVVAAPELCSGAGLLFGGWGLGLLVEAACAEGGTLSDLSAGFHRPVPVGSRVAIGCEVVSAGRTFRHCQVEAHVDGQPAFGGRAVIGPRPGQVETGPVPARVPPPEDCPEREYASGPGTGVAALLDVRVAGEFLSAGIGSRALLWVRTRRPAAGEVRLAVASDHVPYLLRRLDPRLVQASTVSAALRVVDDDVDEWILVDIGLVARGEHTAVGRVTLWSGGRRLAGVAEQTTALRHRRSAILSKIR